MYMFLYKQEEVLRVYNGVRLFKSYLQMYFARIKIANKFEVSRICNDISKFIMMYFCILNAIDFMIFYK